MREDHDSSGKIFSCSLEDYQLTSVLASCCGSAGVVYAALHAPEGRRVALKRCFVDHHNDTVNSVQSEIQAWKDVQHDNILPYLTSFVHGCELYVASPLMEHGSCRDLISRHFPVGLSEPLCAVIIHDVLKALQYLHKQGVVHRGVRASHVLVSDEGAVLSGLRSAASLNAEGRRLPKLHSLPPGQPGNHNLVWLSPELLEQNASGYDEKSDVYSVGMLCCELANGAVPFADLPRTLMLTEKVRGTQPQLMDCTTFPLLQRETDTRGADSGVDDPCMDAGTEYATRRLSQHFHNFAGLCLQRDPEDRPSAATLLGHPFLKLARRSLLATLPRLQPQPDDMAEAQLREQIANMDLVKNTEWDF